MSVGSPPGSSPLLPNCCSCGPIRHQRPSPSTDGHLGSCAQSPKRKCWVDCLQQLQALQAAGWAKVPPGLTPPLFWFQALFLVVLLGWVFVPIYIKAGVSICSVIM